MLIVGVHLMATLADDRTFTITGGTAPYSVVLSNDTTVINYCAISIVGNTLAIDPDSVAQTLYVHCYHH